MVRQRVRPMTLRRLLSSIVLLALVGCNGDDSPTGPDPVATSVEVSPAVVMFTSLGATVQLSAVVKDQTGAAIPGASLTWSSSFPETVSVSTTGLATAVSPGLSMVSASSGSATGTATVSVGQIAASIVLSPDPAELDGPGDTLTVDAQIKDAGGSEIAGARATWSSNDEAVVSVSTSGLLTAVGPGATTLTATVPSAGQSLDESITVSVGDGVLASPGGGQVSIAGGAATLSFPPGALTSRVFVTAEEPQGLPHGSAPVAALDFGPDGLVFGVPVTLAMKYDPAAVPQGVSELDLRLHKLVSGVFIPVEGSSIDAAAHTVSAPISGFSTYAVLAELSVTTASLPDAAVGASYIAPILAVSPTGGSPMWSLASGSLPPGLSLSATGAISGSPESTGEYAFTVQVTRGGQVAQRALTITVYEALNVTTATLGNGVVGSAYVATLSALGGASPYAWAVISGSLPPGLSLAPSTGGIIGAPTAAGTFLFTVEVTSVGQSAQKALSITVVSALEITTASLPDGVQDADYGTQLLGAEGGVGDYAWSVVSGSLPIGLSLSTGGAITGTPTASGTSNFTVQVTSGAQAAQQALSIEVDPQLSITTASLPTGVQNQSYDTQSLAATGGTGSYSWSVASGALPSGLDLSSEGSITGTPTGSGTANFTVEVASGSQTDQTALSITVNTALQLITTSLASGAKDEPFEQALAASGGDGNYSWSVVLGALPPGVNLASDGTLSGTPTSSGTFAFTVEVVSGDGQSAQRELSTLILGQPAQVTDLSIVERTSGSLRVTFTEVDDGAGDPAAYAIRHALSPIEWEAAGATELLVTGAQIGQQREVTITGLSPGTLYDVQLIAYRGTLNVDAVFSELSNVATGSTTAGPPVSLSTSYLVGGYPNTAYADQVAPATGGTGTYTYVVTDGALPAGLSLSSSTGVISGTSTAPGVYFFEITATSGAQAASATYAITISTVAPSQFNVWVSFNGGPIPPVNTVTALKDALARWEEVVLGDVSDQTYPPSGLTAGSCGLVDASRLNGAFIDDVVILMGIAPIDGPSGTLARAGPCGYARGTLPTVISGQMQLDEADAASASAAYMALIIWHEIGHVMGIGTLWSGLLSGSGTATPRYTGANGSTEWLALGGAAGGPYVQPSAEAHWHEAWFNSEIMTPTTEGPFGAMPISRVTIGTLMDLGWTVDLDAADAYALPGCAGSCALAAPEEGEPFDGVIVEPLLPLRE